MTETEKDIDLLKVPDKKKLMRYQQGIRGLLQRIQVDSCDSELKENLKAVYELLQNLRANEDFLARQKEKH